MNKCLAVMGVIISLGFSDNAAAEVKNVILVIADGLGVPELGFALTYAHYAPNSVVENRKLIIEEFMNKGVLGLAMTNPECGLVADSAAAGSALATGHKTVSEALGLDEQGNPVESILEVAKRSGKSVGLVTNTKITHGTPASFMAHLPNRYDEMGVAIAMVDSQIDVFMGGGISYFLPRAMPDEIAARLKTAWGMSVRGYRRDERNLLKELQDRGYQFVCTKSELAGVQDGKVLGLFGPSHLPDVLTLRASATQYVQTVPSLGEMAEKAVTVLSKNRNGFFLVVEAGQIDFTCHSNDAGATLHEILEFDRLLGGLKQWVEPREDTVIVVTSDHETGGLTLAYSRHDVPKPRSLSGLAFKDNLFKPSFNYGKPEILDLIYAQQASFDTILKSCDDGDGGCTAEKLMELFNANVSFPLTLEEARRVLEEESNKYFQSDNYYLAHERFPAVDDYEEFYVYGKQIRSGLLARAIGPRQSIAWGAGTHSAAPVLVVALGPSTECARFSGLYHQKELAGFIAETLRIERPGRQLTATIKQ